MIARTVQIIMLLLFSGNFVSSSEEQKIADLNETLSTLGFKSVSSDVVEAALKSYDYDADEALLYLIEKQDKAENNETLSVLGLFNSQENQVKSQDTAKTQKLTKNALSTDLVKFVANELNHQGAQKMKMVDATWSKIEMYKTMFPTVGSSELFGDAALFRHLETEEFEWEDPENVVCYEFWFDEENCLTHLSGKENIQRVLFQPPNWRDVNVWDHVFDSISLDMIQCEALDGLLGAIMYAIAENVHPKKRQCHSKNLTPLIFLAANCYKSMNAEDHPNENSGTYKAIQKALEKGALLDEAHVDEADALGRTALHFAAQNGNEYVCRLLLRSGADINVTDNSGHTPVQYAVNQENFKIAAILRDATAAKLF